ncbi:N-acetylglucosamine kinase [Aquibium sp. A9E412]|uniref:BadF/BadG/BcrA/BcrD ATPase family protein n=1 Tax=Aquibium sp. A9E412 TaxID=2976767 RepID=UPI0025B010CC|nr:BadF/BadG/BcrA/BcrD ATPase family protein [Aquibium sp. A9E412]MDN2566617.1 N-acetylglucosamine kinase [Aquibium sp. A9E412]
MPYVLAVDGGGTGCRALVAAAAGGPALGRGEGGAANIVTDPDGALASIEAAARAALAAAGLPPATLAEAGAVLGLAGANIADHGARLARRLPFAAAQVETDAAVALAGALGAHDGGIAILGTGSAFLARRQGRLHAVGGWGFVVGDQGSGARLGRALFEETLLAHDRVRAGSPLTEAVLSEFGGDPHALVDFAQAARPGDFARYAPRLFAAEAAGDRVAADLLGEAVGRIEAALAALMPDDEGRLCLLGGLAPLYAPRLGDTWRARLAAPAGDALDGALALARRRYGGGGG